METSTDKETLIELSHCLIFATQLWMMAQNSDTSTADRQRKSKIHLSYNENSNNTPLVPHSLERLCATPSHTSSLPATFLATWFHVSHRHHVTFTRWILSMTVHIHWCRLFSPAQPPVPGCHTSEHEAVDSEFSLSHLSAPEPNPYALASPLLRGM